MLLNLIVADLKERKIFTAAEARLIVDHRTWTCGIGMPPGTPERRLAEAANSEEKIVYRLTDRLLRDMRKSGDIFYRDHHWYNTFAQPIPDSAPVQTT